MVSVIMQDGAKYGFRLVSSKRHPLTEEDLQSVIEFRRQLLKEGAVFDKKYHKGDVLDIDALRKKYGAESFKTKSKPKTQTKAKTQTKPKTQTKAKSNNN